MAWFNLTPLAKLALASYVAEGVSSAVARATQPEPGTTLATTTPAQRLAMAKIIAHSEWAEGKTHEEVHAFCRTMTDERWKRMFGPIPRG